MKKFLIGCVITVFALVVITGAFAGGFLVGHFYPTETTALPFLPAATQAPASGGDTQSGQETPAATAAPTDMQVLFAPFWEAWTIIHEQYVNQPVDDVALMRGAINGMMDTLDFGLNYYMSPEEAKASNDALNGKDYTGIGAYVDTSGDYLTVISPIPGSPAEKAGLRPRDVFIAIDGADMTGINPEEARQKVLGPAGTDVTLTVVREGVDKPFDVTITRAKIVIPLVEHKMLDNGIGYIKINTFGDTVDIELREALKDIMSQNPKGLILDLRNNGGGYLNQAIAVGSEFLPEKLLIVTEKYGDGTQDEGFSTGGGLALDIPMVVLANEGSASASEIVAGAIQDHKRAPLVGVVTYGKGSVQILQNLKDEQGVVGITIAQWLTPNGNQINKKGLTPDYTVEMTDEDYTGGKDPQLDKAVELLTK